MATHSSVLAWRIPGTAEPGGLPSMGSYRVGHDCSDLAAAAVPGRPRALPLASHYTPHIACAPEQSRTPLHASFFSLTRSIAEGPVYVQRSLT